MQDITSILKELISNSRIKEKDDLISTPLLSSSKSMITIGSSLILPEEMFDCARLSPPIPTSPEHIPSISSSTRTSSSLSRKSVQSYFDNIPSNTMMSRNPFDWVRSIHNNIIADQLITVIIKKIDEGSTFNQIQQLITEHVSQATDNSESLINWLVENQDKSQYAWFLGLFYYYSIEIK
jgi:hypothetical protein